MLRLSGATPCALFRSRALAGYRNTLFHARASVLTFYKNELIPPLASRQRGRVNLLAPLISLQGFLKLSGLITAYHYIRNFSISAIIRRQP